MAGGGGSANTRTENIRTSQICGLKTGKKKEIGVVVAYQIMGQNSRLA